ncbi:MAG: DinB family protein [Bryobacteraceae bacterium]
MKLIDLLVAELAHHRGQMTVYLRLMGVKVPAFYDPPPGDKRFD